MHLKKFKREENGLRGRGTAHLYNQKKGIVERDFDIRIHLTDRCGLCTNQYKKSKYCICVLKLFVITEIIVE